MLDLDGDSTPPTHAPSNQSTDGSGIDELLSLGNPQPVSKQMADPLAELMGLGTTPSAPKQSNPADDLLGMFGGPTPPAPIISEYC